MERLREEEEKEARWDKHTIRNKHNNKHKHISRNKHKHIGGFQFSIREEEEKDARWEDTTHTITNTNKHNNKYCNIPIFNCFLQRDRWASIVAYCRREGEPFVDDSFPPSPRSLYYRWGNKF